MHGLPRRDGDSRPPAIGVAAVEQTDLPITPVQYSTTVGPQPLLVRVGIDATLAGGTESLSSVTLLLEPRNDLIVWTPVTCCYNTSPPPPFLQPSFDDIGVDLAIGHDPLEPSVMVLGLSAQPLVLPNALGLLCLLLPSPDILVFAPA